MRNFTIVLSLILLFPTLAFAGDFQKSELSGDSFYTGNEAQSAQFQTSLSFLLFPESGWTEDLVREHVKGLAQTYLQCGLKISTVSIYMPSQLKLPVELSKFQKEGPTSLAQLAAATIELPHPLVFLIAGLSDAEGSPFSRAKFTEMTTPIASALENTLWFPMYVNSPEYINERSHSPYSSLAHELTHILTLDGDHNNDPVPNLMTIYMRRTNLLTPELCTEILSSQFVRPSAPAAQLF
ncbi:MAG: hypothetical protein ACXVA9_13430 [Bdellovibrionales bacterium]